MGKLVNEKMKNDGSKGIPFAVPGKNIPERGSWKTFYPEIDQDKCIKCHLCWLHCPDAAITVNKDKSVKIDCSICKGCGICANVCPVKAIEMKRVKK